MPELVLPSGKVITVKELPPKGASQEFIMRKLIEKGLAEESDFVAGYERTEMAAPSLGRGMIRIGRGAEELLGINGPISQYAPRSQEEAAFKSAEMVYPMTAGGYQMVGEGLATLPAGAGIGAAVSKAVAPLSKSLPKVAGLAPIVAGGATEGAMVGAADNQALMGGFAGGASAGLLQAVMPPLLRRITAYFGNKVSPSDIITVLPNGVIAPTAKGQQLAMNEGLDIDRIIKEASDEVLPPQTADVEQITNIATSAIKKPEQATKEILENVPVNPSRAAAAAEEGMQLTPGALVDDPAFIQYQAAISSMPGSKVKAQQIENIMDLGKSVDNLRNEIAGTLDVGIVDDAVVKKFNDSVTKIRAKEERVFNQINEGMVGKGLHSPDTLFSIIENQAAKVGGMDKLATSNPALFKIYKDTKAIVDKDGGVTYGYIDAIRKQIGAGYQKSGSFADASSAELDTIYGSLSQDQKAFLESVDPLLAKRYEAVNKATQIRKTMEDDVGSFQPIAGKDGRQLVSGKFVSNVSSALRDAAASGNPQKFNQMIEKIPKQNRQQVVVSALEALISGKRYKTGEVTGVFADVGTALERNQKAKQAIYAHLPDYAQKRLDNLFMISKGVFNLEKNMNKSLTARDVNTNLQQQIDSINKLYGGAAKIAGGLAGANTGVGGAAAGGTLAESVTNAMLSKTKVAVKADDLLSSPQFQKAIQDFATDNVGVAEMRIKNAPAYKAWLKEQDADTRKQIEQGGFFRWFAPGAATSTVVDPQIQQQKDEADQAINHFGGALLDSYGIKGDPRKAALDLAEIASHPKEIGIQLLGELYQDKPEYMTIAEEFIGLSENPEIEPQLMVVGNILKNSGILPPEDKEEAIANMVNIGIEPQKAYEIANQFKPVSKSQAKKISDAIKAKLTPENYQEFSTLIQSIEALA